MCGVGWLCSLVLEKWSFEAVVYVPAVHSLLATRALCASYMQYMHYAQPYVGCVGTSVVAD